LANRTFGALFDPIQCSASSALPLISDCPIIDAPALAGRLDESVFVDFVPGTRPQDIADELWTVFARASVIKEQSWGSMGVDYFRREDAAAGSGSTTIRDSVTGEITIRPGWRFDLRMRGNWNKRRSTGPINRSEIVASPSDVSAGGGQFFAESVALVPNVITEPIEIGQIWADATLGRPVFHDILRLELRFQYLKQDRADQPIVGTFENFFGEVRVVYRFKALEY
jgi:hypothetical protein